MYSLINTLILYLGQANLFTFSSQLGFAILMQAGGHFSYPWLFHWILLLCLAKNSYVYNNLFVASCPQVHVQATHAPFLCVGMGKPLGN